MIIQHYSTFCWQNSHWIQIQAAVTQSPLNPHRLAVWMSFAPSVKSHFIIAQLSISRRLDPQIAR